MKFLQSLVESGFPLDQKQNTGEDPLMIFVHGDRKQVSDKVLNEAASLFFKAGYKPSADFVLRVLKNDRVTEQLKTLMCQHVKPHLVAEMKMKNFDWVGAMSDNSEKYLRQM